nr:MAG: hypothetical protein [Bacteriophage sp.]
MEQVKIDLDSILDDVFSEQENEFHKEIVRANLSTDLRTGQITNKETHDSLINWFCRKFFIYDLEVSCTDLYEIAQRNGIKLIQ